MSKKKTLVALGYFEKPEHAPGAIIREGEIEEEVVDVVSKVGISSVGLEPVEQDVEAENPVIVEQDLFFCKFCDKFFETLKGKEVHESRWCKEKP